MSEKIPVVVYPFQADLLPIIRSFDTLQSKYELKRILTFPGSGLVGKDAAFSCNLPEIGLEVGEFTTDNLEGIEYVLMINPLHPTKATDDDIIDKSIIALGQNRSVKLFCNRSDSIAHSAGKLREIYPRFSISFDECVDENLEFTGTLHYKKLDVPVLLLGSLIETPEILDIICYLSENFSKENIKCLIFANTPAGSLFGFKSGVPILSSNEFSEATKVEELNRFANNLISRFNPDIVLIEAPDAVLRFNDITPNGFGIQSYMISQAFQPDHFICSIPIELAIPDLVLSLSKDFETRIGTPITAALASNIAIDAAENLQTHSISYVFIPMQYYDVKFPNNIDKSSIPIYKSGNRSDIGLCDYICQTLGME